MFKIGEFSKLVRVSPRMLRHYEKCGLVNPARTDGNTGYRYYSADQIPLLARIAELRDVGCSIEEIGDILPRYDDAKCLDAFLRAKAASVQSAIDAENEKLRKLECLSNLMKKERAIMLYEVELKSVDAVTVLALRGTVPRYRDEHLLWTRLGAYLEEQGVPCRDGGYSTYLDDEYQDENPEIEIAVPVEAVGVAEPPFTYRHYPSIPLAATLRFSGPFDGGYDAACEKLACWMEANGYEFAGKLRGRTLTAPDEEPDLERWLVELQAPVRKVEA